MSNQSQKEFLAQVKKTLEAKLGRLTWDEMAIRAKIEPRALKTYRMPQSSEDYRLMPTLARQAIEALLAPPARSRRDVGLLIKALASLVLSQAKTAILDKQVITGVDFRAGSRGGLSDEDRKIMAIVSKFSMEAGLRDFGGEIHNLLYHCTLPLEAWLAVPELMDAGYGSTVLIDPDYGIPTPEAQELASDFSTVTAHLEERLFAALKDALKKYPTASANEYYTVIREFIVRNPVVTADRLFDASKLMPGALWMAIQQEYYEAVPQALSANGQIILCAHCNSMMKPTSAGARLRCQSRACSSGRPAKAGGQILVRDARRVKAGIRQYWVEPGVDEIRLYDALVSGGADALLYPEQDRVDIAVGNIGMDLKTYVSPEILGSKFRKGIGGLAHYEHKWIVIPDWLVAATPAYLSRLRDALAENASRVNCLSLSDALAKALNHTGGRHA